MRGPASGNGTPGGPMSLGHARPRQLCPCSRSGWLTSFGDASSETGMFALARDRTQLNHPGTMAPECSAREGRKHPTSPCLVNFTAGFVQMTWKSAVSSAVAASCLGSFTPGRRGEKQKLGVTTASLVRKAHEYLSDAGMF